MAASFPVVPGSPRLVGKQNTVGQTTLNVSITGAVGSYSAWAQATASSASEYYVVGVVVNSTSTDGGSLRTALIDVGVGGAGSEVALGTASFVMLTASVCGVGYFPVPLRISAGSRISARAMMASWSSGSATLATTLLLVPYASVEGN